MKLHMCVYLSTKFQVSRIILTSFRQGVIYPPLPPTSEQTPKKPTQIRVNDLHVAIKHCKVHHFTDDNLFNKSLKILKKLLNIDLKNLTNWFNANKISLNVSKLTNYFQA